MAKQPLNVELFYGDEWHTLALANDPTAEEVLSTRSIEVASGRGDELGHASPSTAAAILKNATGIYNPRNPSSPLYGATGRNAPVRLSLGVAHPGGAASSLVASTAHVAPSVTAPTLSGILICAWSGPFPAGSYTAPGGMTESLDQSDAVQTMMVARQVFSAAGATGTRTATSSASETWLACSVLIHGPTAITTGSTGVAGGLVALTVDGNAGDWWILIASFGWDDANATPVAFPWDTDGGGWILMADTGTIASADSDAAFNRMKVWAKPVKITDAAHTVTFESTGVDSTIAWLTRVPTAEIDSNWSPRMHGEVSSWSPKRALSAHGSTARGTPLTDIEMSGITRRLTQGSPPALSAARRTGGVVTPAGYWPLEGGVASEVTPCVAGDSPAATITSARGVRFGDQAPSVIIAGSSALPTFGPATTNVSGSGTLTPSVGTLRAKINQVLSNTAWHCGFVARAVAPSTPAGSLAWGPLRIELADGGGTISSLLYTSWVAGAFGTTHGFDVLGVAVAGTFAGGFTTFNPWEDQAWHVYWFEVSQAGGNVACKLYVDGIERDERFTAGTLARPVSWIGPTLSDAVIDAVADDNRGSAVGVGHVMFGDATHGLTRDEWHDSIGGHPGEPAGLRFARLCAQEGIECATIGDPADTREMGPQYPDTLINLLREAERTDDALLYDSRTFFGLAMRTGRSLYNRPAVLELDYDLKQMALPFDPIVDDLFVRNDVTASRREGSTARAVRESGPLNVSEPRDDPEGVGRYPHQADGNPFSDLVLPSVASWHLHRGTIDETRWPSVTVDLDASPEVAAAASVIDPGDRINIDNHPDSPDPISLIALGASESIESHRRKITFTCVPEKPFHILELEHDDYSIVGSDTATLNEDLDTTETGVDVALGHCGPWVHEVDFDIMIGGERMTLTAVSAAAGTFPSQTQTFTVTRSVNGLTKSHSTGVRVELFHAAHFGQ